MVLVAAILLGVAGPGAESARALGGQPFQVLLNSDGSGRIFMNDGSAPSWKVCSSDLTGCTPFATGNFDTRGAAPGSVFWAGGNLSTPLWKGNLRAIEPPSVRGIIRGNAVVTPVAGTWAGGWGTDYDDLGLSICMTPSGERCLQINHEGPEKSCGAEGATLIDPAFTGRYLRVVDRRYGSGAVFAGVGHPAYYPVEGNERGATVSIAVVGRIAPATGPPSIDCGPPPLFTASVSGDGSALVSCAVVGCRAVLTARGQGRAVRLRRRLPPAALWGEEPVTLRLSPSSVERFERGPIMITVTVNGRVLARRSVRLGALPVVAAYPEEIESVAGPPTP
ncbi:MAG TPA: hypothetical protein VEW07_04080 [Solirubrobacterales bacterium]|nr:hypothetical protein [Solirubrobacterales bacterium]